MVNVVFVKMVFCEDCMQSDVDKLFFPNNYLIIHTWPTSANCLFDTALIISITFHSYVHIPTVLTGG